MAVLLASAAYSTYTVRLSRVASKAPPFDLAAGKTMARAHVLRFPFPNRSAQ